MDTPAADQIPSQPAKPRGKFTGERRKAIRPDTYRRVVELLAEPRSQVPYDHIARLLHVGEHTIKAVEKAEAISIAERKQRLLVKAARIADTAADRIEDQIGKANVSQAAVVFGIATEKMLLLNNAPTLNIQHAVVIGTNSLYDEFKAINDSLVASLQNGPPSAPVRALPPPAANRVLETGVGS